MAHFAELDDNNVVKQVIVVNNNELLDESGNESEQKGIDFCVNLFGGKWIQASYNKKIRKYFPGVRFTYDPIRDAFIPPKPEGEGWTLDETDLIWVNPEFSEEDSPYI
jgi:hypothetical protein